MKKLNVKAIIMLMVFSAMFLNGNCQVDYTWIGSTNNLWSESTNWSPTGNPGSSDNVLFDYQLDVKPCLLDVDVTINHFTIDNYFAVLSITSTLTVLGDFYVDQPSQVWINTGTVVLAGNFNQTITIIDYFGDHHLNYLTIDKTDGDVILGSDIYIDIESGFVNTSNSTIQDNGHIIYEKGNPLPIELISFTTINNIGDITLYWSTASEENNNYFIIEKSNNCFDWYEVVRLPGAGNSMTTINYSWIDKDPLIGTSYYRLTQVDYNGKSETFGPISINFSGIKQLIYPNPARDIITFPDYAKVVDQQGKTVLIGTPGENNISQLVKGLYYAVINGNSQSFIKQ